MNYKKWFDIHIKHKGVEFPKPKIPKRLKYTEELKHKEEGATVFDWIKNKFDILFSFIGSAKKTIDKYISVVPDVKIIVIVIFGIILLYILFLR